MKLSRFINYIHLHKWKFAHNRICFVGKKSDKFLFTKLKPYTYFFSLKFRNRKRATK